MAYKNIDTKTQDFAGMQNSYTLLSAIIGGTEAVRSNAREFIPPLHHESGAAYKVRVNSAVLANFFDDAVNHISSRPFGVETTVTGSEQLDLETFDVYGRDFVGFAFDYFKTAVIYGEAFALIEYPKTAGGETLAYARLNGLRPYALILQNNSIIEYRELNGECTHLRFATARTQLSGFEVATVPQIKVFERGIIQTYEKDKNDEWALADEVATGLDTTPVIRLALNNNKPNSRPKPPLLDAAYKQIEHLQVSVALSNVLHLSAYPMLAGQGMDSTSETIETGPNAVLYAPEGSRWEILEPSGQSMALLQSRIDAIERELMLLCLQPFIPQSGNIAALVGEIQANKAHAAVRTWAFLLEDSLEKILSIVAQWQELNIMPDVSLDTGFGASSQTLAEIQSLLVAYQSNAITQGELVTELQKRDLLSANTLIRGDATPTGTVDKTAPTMSE